MSSVNSFNYLIQHLAEVISKQADQVLQEQLGIGYSQYKILIALEWNPRITQNSIAANLGQTEASISRQIKLLKNKGLLLTKNEASNKRKHISSPTPLGMQITEAANALLKRNFSKDYALLLEDNIITKLEDSLQDIHSIVCKPGKVGACDHQLGF